jgi:hypothetical protein
MAELPQRGIRIRTRATITTMFARLFLGDLFIHGIGGAKYDEWTDQMIYRFFGFKPPEFLVATATLHLPIARQRVPDDAERQVRLLLRGLRFHPERLLNTSEIVPSSDRQAAADAVRLKYQWIKTPRTFENARQRHLAITGANEALQRWLEPMRQRFLDQLESLEAALRAEAILGWRGYAFCLYPERAVREMLAGLPHAEGAIREQTV